MTRQALRVFLDEWFCGCGSRDSACEMLRQILALHPLHSNRPEFEALIPSQGVQYLLLYTIDHFDLAEHGGTVGGQWLTDKGKSVLEALTREQADGYEALNEQSCMHGYGVETELLDCPECGPVNRELQAKHARKPLTPEAQG